MKLPGRAINKATARMVETEPEPYDRSMQLAQLEDETFDVLVIGGGITGAYTALDAALRGLRVALVEKSDFASGTSSKSSKMIHGGLRYIEQGNLPLVRHSLLERQRLRRNAPHLVQRLPFMFPILNQDGIMDRRLVKAFEGLLWSYDLAGGWREGKLHKSLSRAETLARCPTLDPSKVERGLLYYDARADDARLTLTVARTAMHHGATVVSYVEATDICRSNGKVAGAILRDGNQEITVRARSVVVATGVWLRDWTGADTGVQVPNIRPAKGVHIALPWLKIRNDCTTTIPVPGRTRRATITRWGNISLLGTTDDDYTGDLDDVNCTKEDMDFLLDGAREVLNTDISEADVVGSIAGCRPLIAAAGGKTLDVKRNHEIRVDPDGLVTVVGGKLTTSRHMAEQTIDAVLESLGIKAACKTAKAYLLGGAGFDTEASTASGGLQSHLAARYGMEAMHVSSILATDPALCAPIVPGHEYLLGEVVYAARYEMARTVDDVLTRRTRLRLYARDASIDAAGTVGRLVGAELGLSSSEIERQVADYRTSATREARILTGASA